jgi:hypothetical protein
VSEKDVDIYDTLNTQISALKEELISCERQNEKLATEVGTTRRLQEEYDKLTGENKLHANKIDELQRKLTLKTGEHSGCKGQLNNLTQQVKTLTEHQESIRLLLEERENSLHEAEAKLVSLEQDVENHSPPVNGEHDIAKMINESHDKINKNIDVLIEKKLASLTAPNNAPPKPGEPKTLFSTVVGASTSPGNISAATPNVITRNAELIEKQEQERRINNILYGISEARVDDNVSIQESDKEFMSSFLETIEAQVTPKQILRLGKESAGKNRPLKVIMKSPEDKNTIMSSLNKLKNADESFRGISVRDDYTLEERQLIKAMADEAKRKNDTDNVTYWKVRGTPKNGLRVVKITTRT